MKEYTLFALVATVSAFVVDRRLGTKVFGQRPFWIFQGVMAFAQLLVNGFLTSRPVFLYGTEYITGFRIGTIPIEDFIYAFAFISFVVILWEFFNRRGNLRNA